jgi:hypothetical protein
MTVTVKLLVVLNRRRVSVAVKLSGIGRPFVPLAGT